MENDRVQADPVEEGKGKGKLLELLRQDGASDLEHCGVG